MDYDEQEQLQEAIAAYRREIAYLQDLIDPIRKLIEIAVLVEKVIKSHFMPPNLDLPTLGKLLYSRKSFLRGALFPNAAFAIDVRNRMSHDDDRGKPTYEEYEKATRVLLEVIEKHIEELERRINQQAGTEDKLEPEPRTERSPRPHAQSTAPQKTKPHVASPDLPPPPDLTAADDDPDVNASTLAEYVFCPRAGVLTHEGGFSTQDEELPSTALLPWYEQDAIEEAYTRSSYLLFALPIGFVALLVIMSLFFLGELVYPLLLLVMIGAWLWLTHWAFVRWRELGKRRLAAKLAVPCHPDPHLHKKQSVDWWGLLRAGYDVDRPEATLRDAQWKVKGRPRRVLQKGSMRIPVHRIKKTEGPIAPQHIVRAMVYCHLIETAEGKNSPFAVILYGNTYQGTTIPNSPKYRELFYTALPRVRNQIKKSAARESDPLEPLDSSICSKCPYGKPRSVELGEKTMCDDKELDPILLTNGRKLFHCTCGDRFKWLPKHNRNRRLRLVQPQ